MMRVKTLVQELKKRKAVGLLGEKKTILKYSGTCDTISVNIEFYTLKTTNRTCLKLQKISEYHN